MVIMSPNPTYDFSHLFDSQNVSIKENDKEVFTVTIGKIPYGAQAKAQNAMFAGLNINVKDMGQDDIQKAMAKGMSQALSAGTLDLAANNDIEMLSAILSWTLADKEGNIVPIDIEVWRALPKNWVEQIENAIEVLNPELDAKFQD